jgi:hypothetical protein
MNNKRGLREFKILIKDKETYVKVTKQMNKEGIRWRGDRKLPSNLEDRNWLFNRLPIYLLVNKYNILSWSDLDSNNEGFSEITPEEYLKENKIMTKADLKDWMIVEDNWETRYIVDRVHDCFLGYGYNNNSIYDIDDYDDDLRDLANGHYITKVFDPTPAELSCILDGDNDDVLLRNIIWQREEPIEMTISEIEEKLGIKNLKIVEEKKDD